jgi:2,4-dienoyl-CoA reductase-like NADH-dependent reductase (Old Yellow Enzyme family)/pyruvate/2-oxoglutarate dehydrogenase complex dihydrolipoamide dehydrogenase (E3) component
MTDTKIRKLSSDPLFQPLKIKHLTLKNRIMSTSHACGMDDDGLPGERYQRYHEEKAKGGLALTMFGGSSNVAPDSPSVFDQLRVDHDRIIPYFQSFSERIHKQGAALMCQITHLGRRGDATTDNWLPTLAPTSVRETLHRSIPREIDENDIKRIVKSFGEAARRCYEGGLDGLETHAAGHLIGQFFSPDINRRTDKYGGSIENRARFALMVHEEIRKQVGPEFLVGMRMSIYEDRGGLSAEDAITIAQLLEQEGAIDFLNCVSGRMDTELNLAEKNMPGMTEPLAPFLPQVKAMTQAISLPVFHAARITDVATARYAIRDGILDMVAMTRAHIADPQIVNKILRGEEDRIRPCFGASHCMYKKPSCIHNVASGRETLLPQVIEPTNSDLKHVVVVGGGPAGLESARVAAERGHRVTLLEATPQLGGQILLAARVDWRKDLISIINWRIAELEHLGVQVHCNTYVDSADVLALNPDVVIVASGGLPNFGNLEGEELCLSSWDVLSGDVKPESQVLVYDGTGRHDALSCAEYLSNRGAKVTLATIDDRIGAEMGYAERVSHRKQLYLHRVMMRHDLVLKTVHRAGDKLVATLLNDLTDEPIEIETDQVVVERGTFPVDEVFQELEKQAINQGVTDLNALINAEPQPYPKTSTGKFHLYRIGDAVSSRSIHSALLDAYRISIAL